MTDFPASTRISALIAAYLSDAAGNKINPAKEDGNLALLAGAVDGDELKVKLSSAVATIVADIVDLDVEAITGASPSNATLYDLQQLLTTIDSDTSSAAADLGTLAAVDFATETTLSGVALESGGNLDDIAARLLRAAAPAAGELPEADASVAELIGEGLFDSGGSGAGTSLATLAGIDFATGDDIDSIHDALLGDGVGGAGENLHTDLLDLQDLLDDGAGATAIGQLVQLTQLLAKSSLGDTTIADILEGAFGVFTPFRESASGNLNTQADLLYDAFSGSGTILLPPPFHDSTFYASFPDILFDAFSGSGSIFAPGPFHDSTVGETIPNILMDVFTGGGALADPNVFIDNTGFSSVADLLYSIDALLTLQQADIESIETLKSNYLHDHDEISPVIWVSQRVGKATSKGGTTITSGGSAQSVVGVNNRRTSFVFCNLSDTEMFLAIGSTAVANQGIRVAPVGNPGDRWEMHAGNLSTSNVSVMCSTTGKQYSYHETELNEAV